MRSRRRQQVPVQGALFASAHPQVLTRACLSGPIACWPERPSSRPIANSQCGTCPCCALGEPPARSACYRTNERQRQASRAWHRLKCVEHLQFRPRAWSSDDSRKIIPQRSCTCAACFHTLQRCQALLAAALCDRSANNPAKLRRQYNNRKTQQGKPTAMPV